LAAKSLTTLVQTLSTRE